MCISPSLSLTSLSVLKSSIPFFIRQLNIIIQTYNNYSTNINGWLHILPLTNAFGQTGHATLCTCASNCIIQISTVYIHTLPLNHPPKLVYKLIFQPSAYEYALCSYLHHC